MTDFSLTMGDDLTVKGRCFLTDDMKAEVRDIVAEMLAERDAETSERIVAGLRDYTRRNGTIPGHASIGLTATLGSQSAGQVSESSG